MPSKYDLLPSKQGYTTRWDLVILDPYQIQMAVALP